MPDCLTLLNNTFMLYLMKLVQSVVCVSDTMPDHNYEVFDFVYELQQFIHAFMCITCIIMIIFIVKYCFFTIEAYIYVNIIIM